MKYHKKRYSAGYIPFLWTIAFVVAISTLYVYSDKNIRPIVCDVAINQAQSDCENIINNSVYSVLEETNTDFDKICTVVYDDEKNIKTINNDTVYLNKLKSKIIKRINDNINGYSDGTISIRLGSFFNNEFLNGRGPRISFDYEMSNNIFVKYNDKFLSAGINQTKHRLMMNIKIELYIITPLLDTSTKFNTDILINESVIVGNVPDSYTSISLN